MRARRGWAWLLSFASAVAAPGARRLCAQAPENAGLTLGYRAHDGCPDRDRFEQRLRARLAQRGAVEARLDVRIAREGSKSVGELSFLRPGAAPALRTIEAPSCEQAVEALALAAALMLDPLAQTPHAEVQTPGPRAAPAGPRSPQRGAHKQRDDVSQEPPQEPGSRAGDDASQGVSQQAGAHGDDAGRPGPDAESRAVPKVAASAEPARAEASAPAAKARGQAVFEPVRRHLTLAAAALVATGVAPAARVGGAFSFGLLSRRLPRLELAGRLGLRVVQRYDSERDEGQLAMSWWSGSAAACAGTPLTARWALDGCLAAELGRLRAGDSDTPTPATSERLWAALGPALLARWHAIGPLAIEGGLHALFPFARHRYLLGDETVHSVPRLTFRAELGVMLQFP